MALPAGFRIALDPGVRWTGDGAVLVGGSPIRLLRLTPAGRELVDRLAAGQAVPPADGAQRLTRRLLAAGLAHPRPPAPAGPAEVAAVIPVRNDAAGLATTLDALARRRAHPIIVVDDASADPVGRATAEAGGDVTVIRRAAPGGPAAARNDGWRATGAEFIAFVDANCEPHPGWLDVLLPHFGDPAVAAVAPRITAARPAGTPAWLAAYEAVRSPLDLGPREANVRPRSPVAYVPTAALVVRRAALEALGGFDEALTVGEDVDFVWRLVAAGWTVRSEPRADVRHPMRPTAAAGLAQRYRYGTSAAPLARRHGAAVAPAVVSPWTAAAWALVAAGQPLPAAAAAGYSVATLARTLAPGEAVRLAGLGHLRGGVALARALRRAWPPAALLVAAASRRSRPALLAAAVAPGLLDWAQRRPRLDPVRFAALHLADDLAYAAGLWAGCRRERSFRALRPEFGAARLRPLGQTGHSLSPTTGGRA